MGEIKIIFRGRKAFPNGTVRDYGKYGQYEKKEGKWIRLKKGYPASRKVRLELRKHKYIRKIRKKGKYGEWEYVYKEKKSRKRKGEEKYNFITAGQLRYTNINNFKSGDFITVDRKYIIHLKKEKYNTFSLESSVEDYNTFKPIDSAFWPVYIGNFLHGEYKH